MSLSVLFFIARHDEPRISSNFVQKHFGLLCFGDLSPGNISDIDIFVNCVDERTICSIPRNAAFAHTVMVHLLEPWGRQKIVLILIRLQIRLQSSTSATKFDKFLFNLDIQVILSSAQQTVLLAAKQGPASVIYLRRHLVHTKVFTDIIGNVRELLVSDQLYVRGLFEGLVHSQHRVHVADLLRSEEGIFWNIIENTMAQLVLVQLRLQLILFYCSLNNKAINLDDTFLAEAVSAILGLQIPRRVPVRLEDENSIRCGDVQTGPPGLLADKEQSVKVILLKVVYLSLPFLLLNAPINVLELEMLLRKRVGRLQKITRDGDREAKRQSASDKATVSSFNLTTDHRRAQAYIVVCPAYQNSPEPKRLVKDDGLVALTIEVLNQRSGCVELA